MTELRQEHHHPIASGDARDVKPWRLPYWTEPAAWVAEKNEQEAQQEKRAGPSAALPFPTAEELENIRREAYNAGLEQGLVEGRQQGHKDGFEAGHKEGYAAAFAEAKVAGHQEGVRTGEEEGRRKAQADVNTIVMRLQRVLNTLHAAVQERDQQLPEVVAALVAGICSRVIGQEFSAGAVNILQFVQRALAELPGGEKSIQVMVGPDDARHLQHSLELTGTALSYRVDEQLPAGVCRIETEHSLVEYSSHEYLSQLLDSVMAQLMQQAVTFPDQQEQALYEALAEPALEDAAEVAAEVADIPVSDPDAPDAGIVNTAADIAPDIAADTAAQDVPHEPQ